jgi:hypothetical protein
MTTGYEVKMYADISSIASSLRIMSQQVEGKGVADRIKKGTWPPDISLTYQCPSCGDEIDLRNAQAL